MYVFPIEPLDDRFSLYGSSRDLGDQLGNPAWISQLIFADPMGILILAGDWTFSIRMSSTEANIETQ